MYLLCDLLVLSNVLCEVIYLEKVFFYVRGVLKCNFDWMWVLNFVVEMFSGFLGFDEWLVIFYVIRVKGLGYSRMN